LKILKSRQKRAGKKQKKKETRFGEEEDELEKGKKKV
jgi:hypothetical protein